MRATPLAPAGAMLIGTKARSRCVCRRRKILLQEFSVRFREATIIKKNVTSSHLLPFGRRSFFFSVLLVSACESARVRN